MLFVPYIVLIKISKLALKKVSVSNIPANTYKIKKP